MMIESHQIITEKVSEAIDFSNNSVFYALRYVWNFGLYSIVVAVGQQNTVVEFSFHLQ